MARATSKGLIVSPGEAGFGYDSGILAIRMARATGR